ncbi:MAG: hypothetical protein R2873_19265 [Caldilineaceae bacterium]
MPAGEPSSGPSSTSKFNPCVGVHAHAKRGCTALRICSPAPPPKPLHTDHKIGKRRTPNPKPTSTPHARIAATASPTPITASAIGLAAPTGHVNMAGAASVRCAVCGVQHRR